MIELEMRLQLLRKTASVVLVMPAPTRTTSASMTVLLSLMRSSPSNGQVARSNRTGSSGRSTAA